jgi:hypothetical protein
MRFHRLEWREIDWDKLDAHPERTLFQTRKWLEFVAATQGAEPVVAVLREGCRELGFFTGLFVRKLGIRMLGSPLPGWTSFYMGFNLEPGVSRLDALQALGKFAFHDLRCVHLEIIDRRVGMEEATEPGYRIREADGFEVDLTPTEDDLLANMTSACRRAIRKSIKSGVTIEQVTDLEDARSFVEDYYPQLLDVFAKQSLVPIYPRQRVEQLVEHIFPTGHLLLTRALAPDGSCIATGIFPAFNDTMFFWGGASWRSGQHLRPNEAIQWHAMKFWKARGITRYDMWGKVDYKQKYGGKPIAVPWIRMSRFSMLEPMRNTVIAGSRARQSLVGRLPRRLL